MKNRFMFDDFKVLKNEKGTWSIFVMFEGRYREGRRFETKKLATAGLADEMSKYNRAESAGFVLYVGNDNRMECFIK